MASWAVGKAKLRGVHPESAAGRRYQRPARCPPWNWETIRDVYNLNRSHDARSFTKEVPSTIFGSMWRRGKATVDTGCRVNIASASAQERRETRPLGLTGFRVQERFSLESRAAAENTDRLPVGFDLSSREQYLVGPDACSHSPCAIWQKAARDRTPSADPLNGEPPSPGAAKGGARFGIDRDGRITGRTRIPPRFELMLGLSTSDLISGVLERENNVAEVPMIVAIVDKLLRSMDRKRKGKRRRNLIRRKREG
jgi:hypothetical protein